MIFMDWHKVGWGETQKHEGGGNEQYNANAKLMITSEAYEGNYPQQTLDEVASES